MSLVIGGLDVVGDGDEDMAEGLVTLGAARRLRRKIRVPTPVWMRGATAQGVSRPKEELDVLPFAAATLTTAGAPAALIATPQRPFRGERLVMSAVNGTTGADASAAVSIDPAIFVGAVQVGAAQGAMPVSAFAATAFGVRMSWPAMGQGTLVRIPVVALAVPVDESIVVTAVLFGRAMR
jgi:hypothetical protein